MKGFLLLIFSLVTGGSVSLKDLVQTTYRTAQTTIDCNHQGFNFICKKNNFTCDTILRQTSPVKTIKNVSLQDAGVYWCGTESQTQGYRIHLKVKEIEVTQKQVTSGLNLTHKFKYTALPIIKFFCKGEDPLKCQQLIGTNTRSSGTKGNGRFLFKDDKVKSVTITVRKVTIEDTGSYWCGYKSSTGNESLFFHKLELTVVASVSQDTVTTASVVVGAVLLLLAVFFSYKRFNCFNTIKENQQEHYYEEIDERPQLPGSRTALKTINNTVTLPSEPPPEPLYITLDHPTSAQTRSTEINPSSSSSDETFTINVLYSTMNTLQQTGSS